jgi:TolA-binding protein
MTLRRIFLVCVLLVASASPLAAQNTKENADFKLAVNLFNDGLFDLAAEQLKQFIASYPSTSQGIDARFMLGLAELKLKRFEDARLAFQSFALTYQDHAKAPEAWWHVGEAFAALKNYRDAALAYERVKVFHPRSTQAPDALIEASRYFELAGEPDNARRVLRVALQEYPSSRAVIAARTSLARMYFAEGNLDQAASELKRVIDGDPSPDARAQALVILGQIHAAAGRADQAEARFREVIARHRGTSAAQGAFVHLGRLLLAAGQADDAWTQFRQALAEKGQTDSLLTRDAVLGAADAQEAMANHTDAATGYDRFLSLYPVDARAADVLWRLALSSARAKNFRKSNDACLRIARSDAPPLLKRRALLRAARNAEEQRAFAQALVAYSQYADQYPDDPAAARVTLRAAMLSEKELADPRKAAVLYESVVTRFPDSPVADDALAGDARCAERLGEADRAAQLYRDLIQRFPASDHRAAAEERIAFIETFDARRKDAGLDKLALLVGDVVAEKNKATLAFRLGEIYFTDLKKYDAALMQFTGALESGLDSAHVADAFYLRARSFDVLATRTPALRPQAQAAYRGFLEQYARDPRAPEAALALFRLNATSVTAARAAAESTLVLFPDFPRRDTLFAAVGHLAEIADSLSTASAAYTLLLEQCPDSPLRANAAWGQAGILVRTGRIDSAWTLAQSAADTYPAAAAAAEVLGTIGDSALAARSADVAAAAYGLLVERYPYSAIAAGAQQRQALALLGAGRAAEAQELAERLLNDAAGDPFADGDPAPELLFIDGKAHHQAGNFQEAQRMLVRFLAVEPRGERAGDALVMLGMISRQNDDLEAATGFFRRAASVSPGSAATSDVADLLFENGQYDDALRQYLALSAAAGNDTLRRYYDSRAIVARLRSDDLGPAQKAIAAFAQRYQDTAGDRALFTLETGNLHLRKEEFPAALAAFDRVLSDHDGEDVVPAAMYWRGKTLQAMEKPQDAVQQFDRLVQEHAATPFARRAHLALGNIFYQLEKWDEAIRHYRTLVDDSTADASLLGPAMSNLIETYETAGINDAALALTRRYLELYPHADDALDKKIKIGILYDRLGYYDQAVLHLQTLLDDAGSDLEGEIRYYIAEANYNKGDYQQAILDFLKVPYLVTKKGKIDWTANSLYMAGQAYEKLGRFDQSLTMYQQIVDRPGIDATFKAAAKKEIDRVRLVLRKRGS